MNLYQLVAVAGDQTRETTIEAEDQAAAEAKASAIVAKWGAWNDEEAWTVQSVTYLGPVEEPPAEG